MRRTGLFGIGIALAVCIGAVLLAVETGLIPVAWAEKPENPGKPDKPPEGGGGGTPSTWIGTVAFEPGGAITSDDGPYIDYRIPNLGGTDEVKIEVKPNGQLDRVDVICGGNWYCNSLRDRDVSVNLNLPYPLLEDVLVEPGSSGWQLLYFILDELNLVSEAHVLIQVRSGRGQWILLVLCEADGVNWDILKGFDYIDKYMFRSCPTGPPTGASSLLDFNLSYPGAKVEPVEVDPEDPPKWTISPIKSSDDPVKLDVMKREKPQWQHGAPEFLATYSSLPFQMTVTAVAPLPSSKPAVPPASSSTWGQVKDQVK